MWGWMCAACWGLERCGCWANGGRLWVGKSFERWTCWGVGLVVGDGLHWSSSYGFLGVVESRGVRGGIRSHCLVVARGCRRRRPASWEDVRVECSLLDCWCCRYLLRGLWCFEEPLFVQSAMDTVKAFSGKVRSSSDSKIRSREAGQWYS